MVSVLKGDNKDEARGKATKSSTLKGEICNAA